MPAPDWRIPTPPAILHRDLKPANLFLTRDAEGEPLVKILDFGLATVLDPGLRGLGAVTVEGALTGTPGYMSPEQLRAPQTADSRADVWSLGVILFELLTASRPFGGTTLPDVIASILSDDEPVLSLPVRTDVPRGLATVVSGCLQKDVGVESQTPRNWPGRCHPGRPFGRTGRLPMPRLSRSPVNRPPDRGELWPDHEPSGRPTTAIAVGAAMLALATVPLMSHSARPVAAEQTIAMAAASDRAEVWWRRPGSAEPQGLWRIQRMRWQRRRRSEDDACEAGRPIPPAHSCGRAAASRLAAGRAGARRSSRPPSTPRQAIRSTAGCERRAGRGAGSYATRSKSEARARPGVLLYPSPGPPRRYRPRLGTAGAGEQFGQPHFSLRR